MVIVVHKVYLVVYVCGSYILHVNVIIMDELYVRRLSCG